MARVYLQSIRLALALVCVGASLILGAHWFGLIPDATKEVAQSRRRLSETIAINSASHVRKGQWLDLKTTLQTLVDRRDELLSVGIRNQTGGLRVDTGHHEEIWGDESSGVDTVDVPITLSRKPWGTVELCFRAPENTRFGGLLEHPLVRLIAFFAIAGVIAYTIFVAKVIYVFNNTQVVPERVRQALDTLAEGLLVLDEQARIVMANDAFARTVGVPSKYLSNMSADALPWEFADDEHAGEFPWTLAIRDDSLQTEQMLRLPLDDGKVRIFCVNATPLGSDDARRGALTTFRDVTHVEEHRRELETMLSMLKNSRDEIEEKNRELEILATQDALTGCLNRRAFFDRFAKAWVECGRESKPMSCIMIDNDHFKRVNDTYGHAVGDEVLRQVSAVLRERHKDNGIVCRYGGEEFCVLMPEHDFESAIREAELTRQAISRIRLESPKELRLTASIGVSETRFEPKDPQELINQADVCLYTAKRTGRNCVVPYNEEMSEEDIHGPSSDDRGGGDIPLPVVTALVSTLSYRDANTAEHSRRVANLCVHVAQDLVNAQDLQLLEIAALLHDIGKVGVPDNVLLKPGPLTREEWQIMTRYDRIGIGIIESAFASPALTKVIETQHAFYGGGGRYAELPKGNNIPIAARILAICDSYDAMVSDRVYRPGRSHDEAIRELRRCAPTQFDPELVERFAQIVTCNPIRHTVQCKNEAAIQIGHQVERLAAAIDCQDARAMQSLAASLGLFARNSRIENIALAADKVKTAPINVGSASEEMRWLTLLRDTNELLDVCRSTQSNLLRQSLEHVETSAD